MNTTTGGHNLKALIAMTLITLLFLLAVVFTVGSTVTTGNSDGNAAVHAMSAGESTITKDPYIKRHAEVVASHQ